MPLIHDGESWIWQCHKKGERSGSCQKEEEIVLCREEGELVAHNLGYFLLFWSCRLSWEVNGGLR